VRVYRVKGICTHKYICMHITHLCHDVIAVVVLVYGNVEVLAVAGARSDASAEAVDAWV
jgi:hypothetical protein